MENLSFWALQLIEKIKKADFPEEITLSINDLPIEEVKKVCNEITLITYTKLDRTKVSFCFVEAVEETKEGFKLKLHENARAGYTEMKRALSKKHTAEISKLPYAKVSKRLDGTISYEFDLGKVVKESECSLKKLPYLSLKSFFLHVVKSIKDFVNIVV